MRARSPPGGNRGGFAADLAATSCARRLSPSDRPRQALRVAFVGIALRSRMPIGSQVAELVDDPGFRERTRSLLLGEPSGRPQLPDEESLLEQLAVSERRLATLEGPERASDYSAVKLPPVTHVQVPASSSTSTPHEKMYTPAGKRGGGPLGMLAAVPAGLSKM